MKIVFSFICILMMFSFVACEEMETLTNPEDQTRNEFIEGDSEFVGIDMDGETRSCSDNDDLVCSMVFTESDQFALDCQRDGNYAIQCGCHDWICVDQEDVIQNNKNIEFGYNINGEADSCKPFDFTHNGEEVYCTMEFTEEDQFAIDCQEAGHRAVQCGCHSYICVE